MAISKVHLLLAFLLVVPPVMALQGTWVDRVASDSHVEDPCGNVTIVYAEGSDTAIPWVTFVISIPVVPIPGFLRIWRLTRQSLGLRHRFFVWSLILGLGDYILWCFYTSPCRPVHAQFPILLTSAWGLAAHVVLIIYVTFKLSTSLSGMRLLSAAGIAVLCLVVGGLLSSLPTIIDVPAWLGWFSLGLGVLSHLFRMKSMDYDNFDPALLAFHWLVQQMGYCGSATLISA